MWDFASGKEIAQLEKFAARVTAVAFSPDNVQADHSIKMVVLTEAKGKALMFKGHENSVLGLSNTLDGKTLASCGYEDRTVRVWDVESQTSRAVIKLGTEANSVAITPDGRWVAVATGNGVHLWEKIGK